MDDADDKNEQAINTKSYNNAGNHNSIGGNLRPSTSVSIFQTKKRKLSNVSSDQMNTDQSVYVSSDDDDDGNNGDNYDNTDDTQQDIEKSNFSIADIRSLAAKKTTINPLEGTNGEISLKIIPKQQANNTQTTNGHSKADSTFMETIMCMMDGMPAKMKIELKSKIFNLSTKYQTASLMGLHDFSYTDEYSTK